MTPWANFSFSLLASTNFRSPSLVTEVSEQSTSTRFVQRLKYWRPWNVAEEWWSKYSEMGNYLVGQEYKRAILIRLYVAVSFHLTFIRIFGNKRWALKSYHGNCDQHELMGRHHREGAALNLTIATKTKETFNPGSHGSQECTALGAQKLLKNFKTFR